MPSSLLNKLSFILCAVFAITVFSLPASAFETTAKQAIIVEIQITIQPRATLRPSQAL